MVGMLHVECDERGSPVLRTSERFVASIWCHGTFEIDGAVRCGYGTLYLTTLRLLFVGKDTSVRLPLHMIENEELSQPLFAPVTLVGTTSPTPGSGIANKVAWRFVFQYGIGVFHTLFLDALCAIRTH